MSEPNTPMSLQAKIFAGLIIAAIIGLGIWAESQGVDIRGAIGR